MIYETYRGRTLFRGFEMALFRASSLVASFEVQSTGDSTTTQSLTTIATPDRPQSRIDRCRRRP